MKKISKHTLLGAIILAVIIGAASLPLRSSQKFHSEEELRVFHAASALIPIDSNTIFPTSNSCKGCHGYDPNGYAMVDASGNDVNIYDDWRSTMMANSTRDPFWRAKVSHEILVFPSHSSAIQDKCTSCHAPNGHYTALYRGQSPYLIEDMLQDTIGMDGVTCSTCHKISTERFAQTFSGEINFDTNRVVYGPYYLPFEPPMEEFVGFKPLLGDHITEAGICAPCHTLITHPFDYNEQPLGTSFIEQATYHEWQNSTYGVQNITCQDCHLPRINEPVVISANYLFLEGRFPYGVHEMAGANTMMLKLMKNNKEALGIDALDEHFDATIAATMKMLQEKSLEATITAGEQMGDSITFSLRLRNKAGHKFPSGYPSRRAFVHFGVINEQGDTIFQSGKMDANYEIIGLDDHFEPHYQTINKPDQVQIYEIVAGDVNGQFTTVLERAYTTLKDNRLVPQGFLTSHAVYDTTLIVGNALQDPDFNHDNGVQGSGADVVHYKIGVDGYQGNLSAFATVYYQSLPPVWMEEIFASSTPEIETFRTMFNAADRSPVAVKSAQLADVYVDGTVAVKENRLNELVELFPNPGTAGSLCHIQAKSLIISSIKVYDSQGRLLLNRKGSQPNFQLPTVKGAIWVEINTNKGKVYKKVLVY